MTYSLFKGTLDYIFFQISDHSTDSNLSINPVSILSIPNQVYLDPGLPNENFSSDHISLLATFQLLDCKV